MIHVEYFFFYRLFHFLNVQDFKTNCTLHIKIKYYIYKHVVQNIKVFITKF